MAGHLFRTVLDELKRYRFAARIALLLLCLVSLFFFGCAKRNETSLTLASTNSQGTCSWQSQLLYSHLLQSPALEGSDSREGWSILLLSLIV